MSNVQLYVSPSIGFFGFYTPFEKAEYVVLGVPFDATSTYRTGSRFGPNAIRGASTNLETYSLRTGLDLETLKICDIGDLNVMGNVEETLDRLKLVIKEIVDAKKFPIILGGEHTCTLGVVKALGEEVSILSFDAHMDLRDEYLGNKLSHATHMRRIAELTKTTEIVEVGVRAFCEEELNFADKRGIRYFTPRALLGLGLKKAARKIRNALDDAKNIYLSVDMDVVDPSYAPAVCNPVPEGISPSLLIDFLQEICDDRVVGLDLTEVSPHYDMGQTAIQAAHIMCEVLCLVEAKRRANRPIKI